MDFKTNNGADYYEEMSRQSQILNKEKPKEKKEEDCDRPSKRSEGIAPVEG